LKEIGELENTLVVVTADHGHGFDVFGSADKKYLAAQKTDRKKRDASTCVIWLPWFFPRILIRIFLCTVGVYVNSGLSGYTVEKDVSPTNNTLVEGAHGPGFPVNWEPRYGIAAGFAANPDQCVFPSLRFF